MKFKSYPNKIYSKAINKAAGQLMRKKAYLRKHATRHAGFVI